MNSKRFALIDLLRTLSFFSISIYHGYSQVYSVPYDFEFYQYSLYEKLLSFARLFCFSGLSILVISMFLFGFRELNGKRSARVAVFTLIGMAILMVVGSDNPLQELFFEWDIYQFIAVSILSLLVLQYFPKLLKIAAILGFLMLWIPFYRYAENFNLSYGLRAVLFGICDDDGRGGWALLPWIGLSWLAFYWGQCHSKRDLVKFSISKLEYTAWGVILVLSIHQWGAYYGAPNNKAFYCFVFRRPPIAFWAHIIWIFLILRISLFPQLNEKLNRFASVQFISQLKINTHFGLCYLIHLVYLFIGSFFGLQLKENLWMYGVFVLLILPVTEILARLALKAIKLRHP